MTDDEFWDDVAESLQAQDRENLTDVSPDDEVPVTEPCPECGAAGACGWDSEGRPLIHALSRT
jgi:hypothetical protein